LTLAQYGCRTPRFRAREKWLGTPDPMQRSRQVRNG